MAFDLYDRSLDRWVDRRTLEALDMGNMHVPVEGCLEVRTQARGTLTNGRGLCEGGE